MCKVFFLIVDTTLRPHYSLRPCQSLSSLLAVALVDLVTSFAAIWCYSRFPLPSGSVKKLSHWWQRYKPFYDNQYFSNVV